MLKEPGHCPGFAGGLFLGVQCRLLPRLGISPPAVLNLLSATGLRRAHSIMMLIT
jgi:hypothetical protein